MSVIPFIVDGPNATVVERREEFESAGGLDGNVILMYGLDRSQLLPSDNSNASYDLRVGQEYRDHRDIGKKDLPPNGVIEMLPGSAVIIETEEEVHFPKSRFGHIVPKVSLLQKGISNTSSKVDPGYHGKLLISVFNLGKRNVKLCRGEPFCTVYVLQVYPGVRPYDKHGKRIVGEAGGNWWHRTRDYLEANVAVITVILIVITLLLTVVQITEIVTRTP